MGQTKIDNTEAVRLYLEGWNTVQLAARYGVAPGSVRKALLHRGVPMRPPHRGSKPTLTAAQRAEAVERYVAGQTQEEVGAILGIARGSVQRALVAAGVRMRPHGLRGQTITVPTDPAVLGYIAGMFDGECNLYMRKEASIGVRVAIYSTTAEVIDWFAAQVGGNVRWDHNRTRRRGWKPIGSWEVYRARDAHALLTALLPYLIIKRDVAVKALELLGAAIN